MEDIDPCSTCGVPEGERHDMRKHAASELYANHLVALAARAGHTLVLDHTLLEWDEDFQEWFIGNDIALIWLHYRVDGSTRRI